MIASPGTMSRERLAIIGTGIAGLTCAHRLHGRYDVTLLEANDYVGGHTNTVDVDLGGRKYAIDTGFIVFNERNYPEFTKLLAELDVDSQPSDMSFSVRCDRTGIEYNGTSVNRLFAQRRNLLRPRFLGMVRDILRFGREATEVLADDEELMTVREYVDRRRYGRRFVEHYLVPIGASIWSCPPKTFEAFPIRFVVEFLRNHAMLEVGGRPEWRVVRGGSRQYVDRIIRPFADRIRLNTPVLAVRRAPDHVEVTTGRERTERFDHVIFACHSDQALAILQDPSDVERDLLGAFPYQRNEAVLHTDEAVLPRSRRAWAAWNYHRSGREADAVTITYNMNILQTLAAPETLCLTLNDPGLVDPARVIDRFVYDHPVYTLRRAAAQRRHHAVIDVNRTSFCGAYWGYGFHEDGVRSGLAVADVLDGAPVPEAAS